jgi:hypothetical protein
MTDLLEKLIAGAVITDEDIAYELYDVCDRTHASCDSDCPVYVKNGNKVPNSEDPNGCDTFKQGSKMLAFLRN